MGKQEIVSASQWQEVMHQVEFFQMGSADYLGMLFYCNQVARTCLAITAHWEDQEHVRRNTTVVGHFHQEKVGNCSEVHQKYNQQPIDQHPHHTSEHRKEVQEIYTI